MVGDEIDGAELLKIGQISAVLPFQQLDRAVCDRNRKYEAVVFWAKLDVVRTVARVDIVTAFPLPALLLFLVLSVAPDYDLSVLPARGKNRARAIAAELRIGPGDFPDGARVRVISVQFLHELPLAVRLARPNLNFLIGAASCDLISVKVERDIVHKVFVVEVDEAADLGFRL